MTTLWYVVDIMHIYSWMGFFISSFLINYKKMLEIFALLSFGCKCGFAHEVALDPLYKMELLAPHVECILNLHCHLRIYILHFDFLSFSTW